MEISLDRLAENFVNNFLSSSKDLNKHQINLYGAELDLISKVAKKMHDQFYSGGRKNIFIGRSLASLEGYYNIDVGWFLDINEKRKNSGGLVLY